MKKPKLKSLIIFSLCVIYIALYIPKLGLKRQFFTAEKNIIETKYNARCIRVIDGDTIEAVFIGKDSPYENSQKFKIRLIGCNTPELNIKKNIGPEYWAEEASLFTKHELENRYIQLSFDDISDKKDKYNRLLCYVWVDEFCFNKILIESGNARFYPNFNFNSKMMNTFSLAEEYAMTNRMGMWKNE